MATTKSELLDVRGAAEFLGVSRHTIYKWVAAGSLPCVKVGRLTRFEAESLRAWIADHRSGGEA